MLQRHLLGIIALGLLALGVYLHLTAGQEAIMGASACLRTGMLSAAIWLAWPKLQFLKAAPPWVWALLAIVAVVLVNRPKLLLIFAPFLIALATLYAMGRKRR